MDWFLHLKIIRAFAPWQWDQSCTLLVTRSKLINKCFSFPPVPVAGPLSRGSPGVSSRVTLCSADRATPMPGPCGVGCARCVKGLIAVICFMWHGSFSFSLVDPVEREAKWKTFSEQLSPAINPPTLPKLRTVVPLFILKGLKWHKASCPQEWVLSWRGKEKK